MGQWDNPQFLSSGGRQGVKFEVQVRDFAALRWEPCLFVLLHPSAAMSSSSKGQNKLHFHLIFFFQNGMSERSGTAFW